jgi:hypothetical protein
MQFMSPKTQKRGPNRLPHQQILASNIFLKSLALMALALCLFPPNGIKLAHAQQSSGLDFRWDSDKDFRKLYYFLSSSRAQAQSDYYFVLSPKDRNTALLKIAISVPKEFDSILDPNQIRLCYMSKGGVMSKTQCETKIPAVIEVSKDNGAIEIFPSQPVPVGKSIGVHAEVTNPFNPGMYQFNALGQAPGDVPISGYLGSWVIEISPST